MMRMMFLLLPLTGCLSGCPKHAVRDASAYRAEIEFNTLSFERSVVLLEEAAADRLAAGDVEGCLEIAETAVVLKARVDWHGAMSMHLAGLAEYPGDAPEIPKADTMCTEAK